MKVITLNANGIRSAASKGFFAWMNRQGADVVCIQETKAQHHQLLDRMFFPEGYHAWYHDAAKPGYSGVAIYSRHQPDRVHYGIGWEVMDREGRWLQADFGTLSVVSLYLPSGSSSEERQEVKFQAMDYLLPRLRKMAKDGRDYLVCGDWNIAHRKIDLKNWRGNQKQSGFLPEERAWLDKLFGSAGWADAFRRVDQREEQYTWWSARGRAWDNNVGWRIDYHVTTPRLAETARSASIYRDERFSDHAPLSMEYDYPLPSPGGVRVNEAAAPRRWQEILFNRRMLICVFLGFASGMPLWVLISLVPAWLRTEGIDLATIGLFSLMTLPYTWKFIWSPLMDRYRPPFLGRRRGWALITQVVLLATIGALGLFDPTASLFPILALVFVISFFSASQDIVIDAYRRELLADDELGTGTSIHINAYRLSALVPGSLALILADHFTWGTVFAVTAVFMTVGIVMTLVIPEVSDDQLAPHTLREAVIEPFREFFGREGIGHAMAVLAFILLYKLGDNMAVALATPFYIDMGFSLTEIGTIAKFSALWASIAGSVIAGIVMLKISINRALWIFGMVQLVTIMGFVWLSTVGHSPLGLFIVVSGEYLGVGMGTVALTAYLARETSRAFTATQFALFSSIVVIPRTFANASTGYLIEAMGYTNFFLLCTAVAVPGMLMLLKVAPWGKR